MKLWVFEKRYYCFQSEKCSWKLELHLSMNTNWSCFEILWVIWSEKSENSFLVFFKFLKIPEFNFKLKFRNFMAKNIFWSSNLEKSKIIKAKCPLQPIITTIDHLISFNGGKQVCIFLKLITLVYIPSGVLEQKCTSPSKVLQLTEENGPNLNCCL